MARQSIRKFKRLLKGGQSKPRMSKSDWREIADVLGKDAGPGVRKKGNPKRKRMTKLQRLNASAKKAKQKRLALAAKDFLRKMNPSVSLRGIGSAVITKLKAGGYSVRPVKNPSKRTRRRKR